MGKKIADAGGRIGQYETYDIRNALEDSGYFNLAAKVGAGKCLSPSELRQAEWALQDHNMYERMDYRLKDCEED